MTLPIASPHGFSHVRLTITAIHRSKAFYELLFGMPPGSDFSDQTYPCGEPCASTDTGCHSFQVASRDSWSLVAMLSGA